MTSMQTSSKPNGSTARRRVVSVVSSRLSPHGIRDEKVNGPAGIGQYVEFCGTRAGSGDGGRRLSHRYDELVQTFRVKIEVVVNRVAGGGLSTSNHRDAPRYAPKLLLAVVVPTISRGLLPITVRFREVPCSWSFRTCP